MDHINVFTLHVIIYIVIIVRTHISTILLQPVSYYKNMKGKNTRSVLSEYIGRLYKLPSKHILFIKKICDDCHNASLVIDDIQDNSLYRRGKPTSHIVYGIPYSLNAGYLCAFKLLYTLPKDLKMHFNGSSYMHTETIREQILTCATQSIYEMHIGQGLDIYWSTYKITPSMQEYLDMIEKKTGTLFTYVNKLCSIIHPNVLSVLETENIHNGLKLLCYFFQIRDDYINITDTHVWKQKSICEDFDEYKQTYMIVLFYHNFDISQSVKDTFFSVFYKSNKTKHDKLQLLRILHEHEILSNTYQYLLSSIGNLKEVLRIPFLYNLLKVKAYQINELEEYLLQ